MVNGQRAHASVVKAAFFGIFSAFLVNLTSAAVSQEITKKWWPIFTAVLVPVAAAQYGLARRRVVILTKVRRVSLSSDNTGVVHLFATTHCGSVLHREYREGGSWGDWSDLRFAGKLAWDVASVGTGHSRVEVFVSDKDGFVWVKSRLRAVWSMWSRLDGSAVVGSVVSLGAVSGWPGHREIFAVDQSGKLAHRWQEDGYNWSDWHSGSRTDCLDVAACSPTKDRIECFVVDNQGRLWHRFWSHHWHTWEQRRRPKMLSAGVAIAALSGSDKHKEVFVVDSSGCIAHRWRWEDSNWSDWSGIPRPNAHGTSQLVDIAAGTTSAGRMEIVAVDDKGQLWQRSYWPSAEDWTTWRPVA